jgi:hypothetical protein
MAVVKMTGRRLLITVRATTMVTAARSAAARAVPSGYPSGRT